MKKPVIGILGNKVYQHVEFFYGNEVTYTPQGFVDGVKQAGGIPLVLPISPIENIEQYLSMVDGLIFAGGQDVTPQLYGEEPTTKIGETYLPRDDFEKAVIEKAIAMDKPIFAVCRGLQLINVVFGGTLYQDLSFYDKWSVKHVQNPTMPTITTHHVRIAANNPLHDILGDDHQVNSYHHQAIKKLAPNLTAIAWSDDELVEAFIDQTGSILGVQWHPELNFKEDEKMAELFHYFVQEMTNK